MKKKIALITVLAMLISLVSVPASAVVKSADVTEELFGNKNVYGFETEGNLVPYYDAERKKEVVKILGNGRGMIDYPEVIGLGAENSYVLEFDIKPLKDNSYFYMEAYNKERFYNQMYDVFDTSITRSMSFTMVADAANNRIGLCNPYLEGYSVKAETEFKKGSWYNVKLFYDVVRAKIHMFVNDEYIGRRYFPSHEKRSGDGVGWIALACPSANGDVLLDNISTKWLDYDHATEYKDLIAQCPGMSRVCAGIDADTDFGTLGNIFKKKEVQSFELKLENRTDEPFKGKILLESVGEENKKVYYTEEFDAEIGVGEEKYLTRHTELKTNAYGPFKLRITAINEENQVFSAREIRYSVVNAPEKGKKNLKQGFAFHQSTYGMGGDMASQMELVDLCGAGFLRTPLFIDKALADPNQDGNHFYLSSLNKTFLELCNEYEIPWIVISSYMFSHYNNEVHTKFLASQNNPSQETLDEFTKLTYEQTQAVAPYNNEKTRIDFGIWNEPNYGETQPPAMAKYLQAGYDGVKKANPDTYVYAFSLGGFEIDWAKKCFNEFKDGEIPCDGMAFHPYTVGSPDGMDWVKRSQEVKDGVYSYNQLNGSSFIATEAGYSAESPEAGCLFRENQSGDQVSEKEQADYNLRRSILNDYYQICDTIAIHTFMDWSGSFYTQNAGNIRSDSHEAYFGSVRSPHDNEVPFAAKPEYIMWCYYNKIMNGATPVESYTANNAADSAYLFDTTDEKTGQPNKTLVAYTIRSEKFDDYSSSMSFKIDAPSVTVSDIYGNETEVYPVNGVYTFGTAERPIYIRGDFKNVEQCEESKISFSSPKINVAKGSTGTVVINNNTGSKIDFDVTVRGNLEYKKTDISDTQTAVEIKATGDMDEEDGIFIKGTKDNKVVFEDFVLAVTQDRISPYFVVLPLDTEGTKWEATFGVSNNTSDAVFNGEVKIKSPKVLADKVSSFKVKNLKPGESQEYTFAIPVEYANKTMIFDADILIDGEEPLSYTGSSDCRTSSYAATAPVIDGVINEGEWNTQPIIIHKENQMKKLDKAPNDWWSGTEDLSSVGYLLWDENYMYFAADVTDNIHLTYDECVEDPWKADSIQVGITDSKDSDVFTEFALALVDGEPLLKFYSSTIPNIGLTDLQGSEYKVTREGTHTYYEVKIPWTKLIPDSSSIKVYKSIAFSYLVNDADVITDEMTRLKVEQGQVDPYRLGFGEYYVDPVRGGGIGTCKDPSLFREFTLLK